MTFFFKLNYRHALYEKRLICDSYPQIHGWWDWIAQPEFMSFCLCLLLFDLGRWQVLDMCYVQFSCNVFILLYLDTHLVHNSDSK